MADRPHNNDVDPVDVSPQERADLLLSAYTDDTLTPEEREEAERMIDSNPQWRERLRTDSDIDASLRRLYAAPPIPSGVGMAPIDIAPAPASSEHSRWRFAATLAIAASLAWLVFAGQLLWPRGGEEIAFIPRPLTEVYRECVDAGFEPYWICDDDRQFAATFERRQGVPLRLAALPDGARMRGLSYLAGLSRESTSMLAEIDEEPVIVFVDRADRDWGPPTGDFAADGLTVWRSERFGLVFYEVSALERPRVTQFLEPVDGESNRAE